MALLTDPHESCWGQRFFAVASSTVIEGNRYYVRLSEVGTEGPTRPGVLLSAPRSELDRDQARQLATLLLHYADTGRLPSPSSKNTKETA